MNRSAGLALLLMLCIGLYARAQSATKASGSWRSKSPLVQLLIGFSNEHLMIAASSRTGDSYTTARVIPIQEWGANQAGNFFRLDPKQAAEIEIPETIYFTQTEETFTIDLGGKGRLAGVHTMRPDNSQSWTTPFLFAAALIIGLGAFALVIWLCLRVFASNEGKEKRPKVGQ